MTLEEIIEIQLQNLLESLRSYAEYNWTADEWMVEYLRNKVSGDLADMYELMYCE